MSARHVLLVDEDTMRGLKKDAEDTLRILDALGFTSTDDSAAAKEATS